MVECKVLLVALGNLLACYVIASGLGVNLILSRLAARNSCGSSTRGKVSERSESLSVLDLNQYRHDRLVGVPLEEPRSI